MKRITCGLVLGLVLSLCGVVLPSAKVTAEGTGVALSDYVQTIEKNGIDTIDPYGGGNLMFSQSGTHPVSGKTDSIGEGDNQETTVTFKNPVYLADNGTETPFVSFSLFSKNQTNRDIDAIIFTLIDVENAENHISVMLGLWDDSNGNKGIMYAKGSGQKFVGYHHTGNGARSWNYPDSQGTLLARNGIGKNLLETIGFYYDYATQKVYCDMYWASYESRGQVFGGKVLIRDLSEELPGYEAAYTQGIERAYLKITTVKGWNLYTDEYGETSNFRHLVGVKHTAMGPISDSGAQYLLRTIDGQDLKTEADGKTITDNGKISGYRAKTENVGTPGEHIVPALMGHSVLRGEIEDKAYTSSLYLQSSGGTLSGTESGKWTENTKLNLIADGTYTVGYYTDAECTQKVAEYTIILGKAKQIDYDNLVFGGNDALFSGSVSAEKKFFATGNSERKSGYTVSAKSGVHITYGKTIQLSSLTKDTPLVEFMPLLSKVPSFDFRRIYFKFSDAINPERYFCVDFEYAGTWGGEALSTVVYAYGDNQDRYGLKYIRNLNEYDCGVAAQSLSGVATKGEYTTFGLYYDAAENCLYMSPTYSWAAGGVSVGKAKLRDFDNDQIAIGNGGTTKKEDEPFWNGFESDSVVMEFWVTNLDSSVNAANVGITKIAGESLGQKLSVKMPSYGITGYEYNLPEPDYFNYLTDSFQNFDSAAKSAIRVFAPDGEETEVSGGKFTPDKSGEYKILYAVLEGDISYGYYAVLNVYAAAEAPSIEFDVSESTVLYGMSLYLGNEITLKASASSEILLSEDKMLDVKGELFLNGNKIADLDVSQTFVCSQTGRYEAVFAAEDYVGRTGEKKIVFFVTRTSIVFVGSARAEENLDITNGKLSAKREDIVVEDVYFDDGTESRVASADFAEYDVTLQVRKDGDDWAAWSDSYVFFATGTYEIRYAVTYRITQGGETYTAEVIRKITAIDNHAPEFEGESNVTGATPNGKDGVNENYKAKKGASVTFSFLKAYDVLFGKKTELGDVIIKITAADGSVQNITERFENGTCTAVLNDTGKYYVIYEATDGTWTAKKTLVFEVKEYWLNFIAPETLENAEFGKEYNLPVLTLSDLNGGNVSDAAIGIAIYKTETQFVAVNGNKWTPDVSGKMRVVWTASKGDETITCERILTVEDNTPPVISFVEEPKTTAYVGETYVLPRIAVTDNADSGIDYEIYLTFNGERKKLQNANFIPDREGEYLIEIECADLSGNKTVQKITVSVGAAAKEKEKGCGSEISFALPAFTALIAVAAVIVKNKKEY